MTRTEWNEWRDNNEGDYAALYDLCKYNDLDFCDKFVYADEVDDMVETELKRGGYPRVICFLYNIKDCMSDDIYKINGYGNLDVLDSWNDYADDIENALEFDEETE